MLSTLKVFGSVFVGGAASVLTCKLVDYLGLNKLHNTVSKCKIACGTNWDAIDIVVRDPETVENVRKILGEDFAELVTTLCGYLKEYPQATIGKRIFAMRTYRPDMIIVVVDRIPFSIGMAASTLADKKIVLEVVRL